MKAVSAYFLLFLVHNVSFSQSSYDQLITSNKAIDVVVEEIGTNIIRYKHPNENAIYEISKNRIEMIKFSNGREEVFHSPIKSVKSLSDYENVFITYVPHDIVGLQRKGEVFSKAVGVTTYSAINNVTNRAVRKLKMEAAMLGANVVYVGNMFQRGNEHTPGNASMATLSGVAYSTVDNRGDIDTMKKQVEELDYHYFQMTSLNRNGWDSKREMKSKQDRFGVFTMMRFDSVYELDGELFVHSPEISKKNPDLKVISADGDFLILLEKQRNKVINHIFLSENEERVAININALSSRDMDKVR